MIRLPLSMISAVVIVVGIFFVLHGMIQVGVCPHLDGEKLCMVDFVRLKKEQILTKKERVKPKKPKPEKKPLKPKVNIQKDVKTDQRPLHHEKLDIDLPIDLVAVSALGDAVVSGGGEMAINTHVIPLARVNPIYPKRAKMMKMEGYVKLAFTITTQGTVKDVEIVESQPANLFDASARRALLKWKFKPKMEDNQPVEQRAVIQIDYELNS